MSYITDRKRAQGHGSANSGTEHFIAQRISALALIPLLILFLIFVAPLIGEPLDIVTAGFGNFWVSLIAAATTICVGIHLVQGLQVIIEDYINQKFLRAFGIAKLKIGTALLVLAALWALLTLNLG